MAVWPRTPDGRSPPVSSRWAYWRGWRLWSGASCSVFAASVFPSGPFRSVTLIAAFVRYGRQRAARGGGFPPGGPGRTGRVLDLRLARGRDLHRRRRVDGRRRFRLGLLALLWFFSGHRPTPYRSPLASSPAESTSRKVVHSPRAALFRSRNFDRAPVSVTGRAFLRPFRTLRGAFN